MDPPSKTIPVDLQEKSHNGSVDDFNTSSQIELTRVPSGIDKEKELIEQRDPSKATSDAETLLHVIKSCLGSGILATPDAFRNGGILFSVFGSMIMGIICTHCTYLVVKSSQDLCYILKKPRLCYAETAEGAFQQGAGQRLKKYAWAFRKTLDVCQFITYYGLNTAYVIIVCESFKEVIQYQFGLTYNIRWYALLLSVILVPIGLIRHMKYLVPFSALANALLAIGLAITMYYIVQDLPPISTRVYVGKIQHIPLFMSTIILGMEGIGTILPIENSMRNPERFLGCPGVLNIAMIIVTSLFVVLGFFGYLQYGENTKGSITLNLPHDWLAESVKICVALTILFTYTLQLTASVEVVWDNVKHKFSPANKGRAYYMIRILLILGTVLLAIAVPNIAPVISFVGSIGFATLGITIPVIIETVLYWEDGLGMGMWVLWKNILLFILAILIAVVGSVTSVLEIIEQYS